VASVATGTRRKAAKVAVAAAEPVAIPAAEPTAEPALAVNAEQVAVPTVAVVAEAAPSTSPSPIAVLVVVGPAIGRRRAGRWFGAEAVRIPLSELSEADVTAIHGDPVLMATLGAIDPVEDL
jgi:hypothetical protein